MKYFFSTRTLSGIYKWASPDVEYILGYTPEEMVGMNPYDLFHPSDLKRIVGYHLDVRFNHIILKDHLIYRIRRKDGKYILAASFSHKTGDTLTCLLIELSFIHRLIHYFFKNTF